MAYLKFLDSNSLIKCSVVPQGENVVSIKFSDAIVVDTSGFDLFLDKEGEVDIGGEHYRGFNTIYRNDEVTAEYNGYQLSNDGSVYVEPELEPEYEPTLEEVMEQKVSEMNSIQQQIIRDGVDVTLTDGTVEHFALKDQDQTSLMGLQTRVLAGDEYIPWHTSDESEHCKFYSNADMGIIASTAMEFVVWHVTMFRDLRIYIRSLQTKEEVEAVYYGMHIPEEYQSEPLKAMIAARNS